MTKIGLYTEYERRSILVFLVIVLILFGFWGLFGPVLCKPVALREGANVQPASFTNIARALQAQQNSVVLCSISLATGKSAISRNISNSKIYGDNKNKIETKPCFHMSLNTMIISLRNTIVAVKQFKEHDMAKSSGSKSNGTSRIRFIMVDAELHDGDIGPITQAIQNALRGPGNSTFQRIAPVSSAKASSKGKDELGADVEDVDDDLNDDDELSTPAPPKRPVSKRVAPTPDVIDMDEDAKSSLKSFMQQANPKSQHKRYLATATWFHDVRQTKSIGVDHVYTCYRILGWPTSIKDFGQPFRELKHLKFFTSPEKGKFDINHLGLAKAKETGANSE